MLNVTFYKDINETDVPEKSGECYLETLKDGEIMFYGCSDISSFDSDLSSLTNGNRMFYDCTNLSSFISDMISLINAYGMFYNCTNLTSFTSDLISLTYSPNMFYNCTELSSFISDLSSLTYSADMFYNCTNLTSFSSELSSLTNSADMFHNCTNLTSFSSDLSSLINANRMFYNCTNLTSFTSDLSSLINGSDMFYKTKLSPRSVMIIASSIRDIKTEKESLSDSDYIIYDNVTGKYSKPFGWMRDGSYVLTFNFSKSYTTSISSSGVGQLTLGIDVTNDSATIHQQLQSFAEGAHYNSWADLKQEFVNKGWTVTFQYGGTQTGITLSEDEQFRGIPVYARLIEVTPEGEEYTEEEKHHAKYCTEDGTKYYNIDWGHDVTDTTNYQYFGSLLEACGYFGVIPKEYLEA